MISSVRWKEILIFIGIFIVFSNRTFSQKEYLSDTTFASQKEYQFIINVDYLSVSIQYDKMLGNSWYAGMSISGGMGRRIIIGKSIKEIDYGSGEFYNGHISNVAEIIKIKMCFSKYVSSHFQHNLGLYSSVITPGEGHMYFAGGFEYCLFYGFNRFKIGQRFQVGMAFLNFPNHHDSNYTAIYGSITPIILQFNF